MKRLLLFLTLLLMCLAPISVATAWEGGVVGELSLVDNDQPMITASDDYTNALRGTSQALASAALSLGSYVDCESPRPPRLDLDESRENRANRGDHDGGSRHYVDLNHGEPATEGFR